MALSVLQFWGVYKKFLDPPKTHTNNFWGYKKVIHKKQDLKAEFSYIMHLYITAWQKETVKIQLEGSKGKGGRHQTLTCDQVSTIPIVGQSNLLKDILARGMSFGCQLGPQWNSASRKMQQNGKEGKM